MIDALDVLRVAVSHGLPGAQSPDEPPQLSAEVIAVAAQHRVQGLLWTAIEAGAVLGSPELIELARDDFCAALRTSLLCEETAVLALTALQSAGVEARVLKGIAIAHLDHANPSERIFGDADLLVRRHHYRLALRTLTAAGFVRAEPPVRGWWEKRYGKAIVMHSPSGGELDLHLAITGGYFGFKIDHDDLWSRASEPFDLGGVTARALDREGRFLQACCHATLGGNSGLRALRDVAQVDLISGVDWATTRRRAQQDGFDSVVEEATLMVSTALGLGGSHRVPSMGNASGAARAQSAALDGYAAASRDGWGSEGRTVLAAISVTDKALFLAGLVTPNRAFLRNRHRTWSQQLRRGLGIVRRSGKSLRAPASRTSSC